MGIFEKVPLLPTGPIFGISDAYRKDSRTNKVDLTVGVYRDEEGKCTIMESVKDAEKALLQREISKTYLPISGIPEFIELASEILFGAELQKTIHQRMVGFQTLGGTGALRIGGDFLFQEVGQKLFVSTPTWPNHFGIFKRAGFTIEQYPYYEPSTHLLNFDKMHDFLQDLPKRSIVLLHACCHNPTGRDPTVEQWQILSDLFKKKELIPFFDIAYQGLGDGLNEDSFAVRHFAQEGHEMLVAHSFSKSFGLYGERIGALYIVARDEEIAPNIKSVTNAIIRTTYSNPAKHGGSIVKAVLSDAAFRQKWEEELSHMRKRINSTRKEFARGLIDRVKSRDFQFLLGERGLFSFTGIKDHEAQRLMDEFGIYLLLDGRINITGLNNGNLHYVTESILKVIEG